MTEYANADGEFQRTGVSHIALVCKDMAKTVDFYTNTLGMPLVATADLGPQGQHFFFDCGGGDTVAFFWFPKAPAAAPGIASQPLDVEKEGFKSAHASLNYLSINIAPEKFDAYAASLRSNGVDVRMVDDGNGMSAQGGLMRSMYFYDPDGIRLEVSAYARGFTPKDIETRPRNAKGEYVTVEKRPHAVAAPIVYGG